VECICRKKKTLEGETCQVTDRKETCLAVGDIARPMIKEGVGREISRDEAIAIIEQNQKEGLVLQPSNTREVDFICSCCSSRQTPARSILSVPAAGAAAAC
jgi:hypothetical protein